VIAGYCRVTTDAQDYKGQETALLEAGAEKVFAEKISGAVTERKALARAIPSSARETACW
jgi:DNA invertase Pin-like site-specific DNA recombinase